MIVESMIAQRSPEWYELRCAKVTASRIGDVIARTQKGWGAARGKYMEQIVAERISGRPQDMRNVRSMTERADMEPDARDAYWFYTGNEVELVGFVSHPTIEYAGASPDGNVDDDGGIEIKCLDASNHIKLLQGDDSPMLDYMAQMMFQMACTGRQWVDFVSYSPIMPEELKLFIRRIPRDDDVIAKLEDAVKAFLAEVDDKVFRLLALTGGDSDVF